MDAREKDLDEVLQTTSVFTNVSKAALAKHDDLLDVFGTADEEAVCRIILAEGDIQACACQRCSRMHRRLLELTGSPKRAYRSKDDHPCVHDHHAASEMIIPQHSD